MKMLMRMRMLMIWILERMEEMGQNNQIEVIAPEYDICQFLLPWVID